MPLVRLNHLINGNPVPYSRHCEIVGRNGDKVTVKIKGAADGHYRDRIVHYSQLGHLESVNVETGLSIGVDCDASGDGVGVGSVITA